MVSSDPELTCSNYLWFCKFSLKAQNKQVKPLELFMAEKSKFVERSASVSSSSTAASRQDDVSLEKMDTMVNSAVSSFIDVKKENDEFAIRDSNDLERAKSEGLLAEREADDVPVVAPKPRRSAMVWMIINTLATIGIVSHLIPNESDIKLTICQGLYQQIHIFRPSSNKPSTILCCIPFYTYLSNPPYSFSAFYRPLHS